MTIQGLFVFTETDVVQDADDLVSECFVNPISIFLDKPFGFPFVVLVPMGTAAKETFGIGGFTGS